MAAIDDLIAQVENPELRDKLLREVARMNKQKKFGLVFEEHLPECTPLYEMPVKPGSNVTLKTGDINNIYRVLAIKDGKALCKRLADSEKAEFDITDLVCVAQFGESIYPYLKPIDTVCNAPDSDLWHTLIEADNYHALQLLQYLYAGKVDCIYIDPPYNTGARDWKYNNDYVDSNDTYRHSKWLSMMKKRLKLAKKLLNPKNSILIVTIDEKEYLHLGCLLEELFPDAHMQMVSIVINPNGVARDHEMYRVEEYAFFIYHGEAGPSKLRDTMFTSDVNYKRGEAAQTGATPTESVRWEWLLRGGSNSDRSHSPGCFYPVYIDAASRRITDVGNPLPKDVPPSSAFDRPGLVTVWPISRGTQKEKVWQMTGENLKELVKKGFAKVGAYDRQRDRWSLLYLGKAQRERIDRGELIITDRDENGVALVESCGTNEILKTPKTIWNRQAHSAGEYGSRMIRTMGIDFAYPKSLYAVRDCLLAATKNNPNALILDFFAGSGTTLHAVNLLNAEDGGHRRCIMVTNNEVSDAEAKSLTKQGYQPSDEEWEKLGIARYVTWPRTVCSIEGHNINGKPLKGTYLGSDLPMADGFKANAAYFKLGFLDKTSVRLGKQFKELLPVLWMKAGAIGSCPELESEELPEMLILPKNRFAVLLDENAFSAFEVKVHALPEIETVFIITDYEAGYRAMIGSLHVKNTYQLYRDYLDNFRINQERD